MAPKPRCLVLFEETIRSKATLRVYQDYLNGFLKWVKTTPQSLLLLQKAELQPLLEDYVIFLKRRLNPNSISPRLSAIEKFLDVNDKEYNKRKLRMMLPEKVKPKGSKAWTTDQISQMLKYADTKRAKALIHFLAATGCRIGAIEELKLKHLKNMENNCKSVTFYAGSKWEYFSFLHEEAAKALEDYLNERTKNGEKIDDESYVFRERYILATQKSKFMSKKAAQGIITKILKRASIKRTREENSLRFDIPVNTGFRKRFNTILKSNPEISYAIAERLMDHRTNLEEHYLYTTVESLFNEYEKAIPQLIIDQTERLKLKNQKLLEEKSELERKIPQLVNDAVERIKEELRKEGSIVDFK